MMLPELPIECITITESIRLYRMDLAVLEDASLFQHCYEQMPASRRQKIGRMRFDKSKRESLGTGILLCHALTSCGFDADSSPLSENAYGKPLIQSVSDRFRFNLSHTDGCAVCAVCFSPEGEARDIGCDVESVTVLKTGIAERFFAREERGLLVSLTSENEKTDLFFRLWTLKESFIKATGLGFSLPFDRFAVLPQADGSIELRQDTVAGCWSFWDRRDGTRHYAVCTGER